MGWNNFNDFPEDWEPWMGDSDGEAVDPEPTPAVIQWFRLWVSQRVWRYVEKLNAAEQFAGKEKEAGRFMVDWYAEEIEVYISWAAWDTFSGSGYSAFRWAVDETAFLRDLPDAIKACRAELIDPPPPVVSPLPSGPIDVEAALVELAKPHPEAPPWRAEFPGMAYGGTTVDEYLREPLGRNLTTNSNKAKESLYDWWRKKWDIRYCRKCKQRFAIDERRDARQKARVFCVTCRPPRTPPERPRKPRTCRDCKTSFFPQATSVGAGRGYQRCPICHERRKAELKELAEIKATERAERKRHRKLARQKELADKLRQLEKEIRDGQKRG